MTTYPCPNCSGYLSLVWRFTATENSSLAGAQPKVSALKWPWLVCDTCDFEEKGKIE